MPSPSSHECSCFTHLASSRLWQAVDADAGNTAAKDKSAADKKAADEAAKKLKEAQEKDAYFQSKQNKK